MNEEMSRNFDFIQKCLEKRVNRVLSVYVKIPSGRTLVIRTKCVIYFQVSPLHRKDSSGSTASVLILGPQVRRSVGKVSREMNEILYPSTKKTQTD